MSRLSRQSDHGHEHKDMAPVLLSYGATFVPDTHGRWRNMRCPFHDDSMASAQTDGCGFRCFTCALFYPAPLVLIRDREGVDLDDAHDRYHRIAGTSDLPIPGSLAFGADIPGTQRHRATGRHHGTARRRS